MNANIVNYLLQFELLKSVNNLFIKFCSESGSFYFSLLIYFLAAFVLVNIAAVIGGLGTYAERKISADMQARIGPNRVGPYGLLQFLADGVKMIMKEDTVPRNADRFLYFLAPFLCIIGIFATLAVLPISSGLALSHLDIGVFYLMAVASLVGLGIFLGGHASNSKWSLLGGMRGASQIISYEIPVTLSIIGVVLLSGSLSFKEITEAQSHGITSWYIFHNPFSFISFFVFFIAFLAEANRAPFDLPEAESELVSGYHTEYSGMRFAFFALAEYIEVFVGCGAAAALFLGGYNVPFGLDQLLIKNTGLPILGQILQLKFFFLKAFLLYYLVIVTRWTLPRLRVDHLMVVCWKYMTPIALFNLLGMAFWILTFEGQSLFEVLSSVVKIGGSVGH